MQDEKRARQQIRLLILLTIFGIMALMFVINFQMAVVRGKSMEPTFHENDRLLITRAYWLFGDIQKGDVVVFQKEGDLLIKRVIALQGETIPPEYAPVRPVLLTEDRRVPPGYVYVVGDNLAQSEDSRYFGPLSMNWVIGKVVNNREKE
jgi:signal peptidase I